MIRFCEKLALSTGVGVAIAVVIGFCMLTWPETLLDFGDAYDAGGFLK